MTSQHGTISWLGVSLQDWKNIAMIFGTIVTFIVALAALLVSVAALRSQHEALPVSVNSGLWGAAMWMKVMMFGDWRLGCRTLA